MNLKMPSLISNNLRILRFMGATRVKSSGWSHYGDSAWILPPFSPRHHYPAVQVWGASEPTHRAASRQRDEVEAAWSIVNAIRQGWQERVLGAGEFYPAGTWGRLALPSF